MAYSLLGVSVPGNVSTEDSYEEFVKETGGRIKQALIASFGGPLGREATAEALGYAWEHWDRICIIENPAGYVFQVGRNWGRRAKRQQRRRLNTEQAWLPSPTGGEPPLVEPELLPALSLLSERQRVAVLLVHGFGWRLSEVAEWLSISVGSAQKHSERGLLKLQGALGVRTDVKR